MAMAPAAGGTGAHQFLTAALSQRGPSALSYAEDAKWLIRNHLLALADAFPSLRLRAAQPQFTTHNDAGRLLLQAIGTIPILHAGASYNLPAVVWLPERYPRCPPLVFLSPTRGMVVKPHHPLVVDHRRSGSGLIAVDAPCLRSWVFPSSNLLDLVRSLARLFGLDPPLLAAAEEDAAAAEIYRRDAAAMACADADALHAASEAEVDALFAVQAELRLRGRAVADGALREAGEEVEKLERRLQDLTVAAYAMEDWVAGNARTVSAADDGGGDAAGRFRPADVVSRQKLECAAMDLAIEDTIYALDKAVQEGAVPLDGYLRSVRVLAREQFFQRALCSKLCS
ncbi:protein ELC-like [Brachypodium distachyon]|nr:protein ELC-like [Brachypodium distachyon]|eukprot:XP_003559262.2 protein ELC-like [Brachypodium distachyon]